MEYKINYNNQVISYSNDNSVVSIDGGDTIEHDFYWVKKGELAVLTVNNKTYRITIVKTDNENKTVTLKVNGKLMTMNVTTAMDELLKSLGLDKLMNKGEGNVKSPMPGLVLQVLVEQGSEVQKGDSLLILEAMKMENVIKSPINGTVKAIHVSERQAIEKNKLMVELTVND